MSFLLICNVSIFLHPFINCIIFNISTILSDCNIVVVSGSLMICSVRALLFVTVAHRIIDDSVVFEPLGSLFANTIITSFED